jgi:hypothetical protein
LERFLASPYGKCVILGFALLVLLGFGYHVVHNLKRAGVTRFPSSEIGRAPNDTAGSQKPQP